MTGVPPPIPEVLDDPKAWDWAKRTAAWLATLDDAEESSLEAELTLGSAELSARVFGFEGTMTGYSDPTSVVMLAAPVAGKKRVIISLTVSSQHTGSAQYARVFVLKGVNEHDILDDAVAKNNSILDLVNCRITLDDTDESLKLEAHGATDDVSYVGSYVELD